ncbi:Programmed cell death protein 2 [Bonamia ostreae]|uniref:Programmed cell death protein 2 n=1 Tax=Bonamia ostreae TaxID=126728 RepID=A0ABV2AK82_9EUKA
MAELGVAKLPAKPNFANDHKTTKFGGSPKWPKVPPFPSLTKCEKCKSQKTLILQLYAPVENWHRQIFVVGCLKANCVNSKNGITAISYATSSLELEDGDLSNIDQSLTKPELKPIEIEAMEEPEEEKRETEIAEKIITSENTEEYEKPKMDQFVKFSLKMQLEPKQFFRYHFGTKPLLIKVENLPKFRCKNCGKELLFEFQLMPYVFRQVEKFQQDDNIDINLATVAFFACGNECVLDDFVELQSYAQKAD